jgi:hypothetical protein
LIDENVEEPVIPEPKIGPRNSNQATGMADYDKPGKVYTVKPDGCEGENDASKFEASDFPTYKDDKTYEVTGIPTIVRSKKRDGSMPTIEIEDLQGRSFLYEEEEDGSQHRAQIIKTYEDRIRDSSHHPEMIKLRLRVRDEEFDELVAYNDIIRYIKDDSASDGSWKFREILDHEGPIRKSSERYNGSTYNLLIEWENGKKTWEPLKIIGMDDPVTCAIYGKKHKLLDEPGWKRFRKLANRQKKMIRMVRQAKLNSFRTAVVYKYGF